MPTRPRWSVQESGRQSPPSRRTRREGDDGFHDKSSGCRWFTPTCPWVLFSSYKIRSAKPASFPSRADDRRSRASRSNRAAPVLGSGRRRGTRPPGSAGVRRAAAGGARSSPAGASRDTPPGDGSRARGLPATRGRRPHDAESRTHFFAMSARLMRQILVDHARRKRADKRGGGATMISLDEASPAAPETSSVDVLALDEALDVLSSFDARQCRVVELRFFAGLNIPEAADALGVSTATVERDWAMAKAWLHQRLTAAREPRRVESEARVRPSRSLVAPERSVRRCADAGVGRPSGVSRRRLRRRRGAAPRRRDVAGVARRRRQAFLRRRPRCSTTPLRRKASKASASARTSWRRGSARAAWARSIALATRH